MRSRAGGAQANPTGGAVVSGQASISQQGKTLTIITSRGAGGPYDMVARLVGKFMTKHLPGQPANVVHCERSITGRRKTIDTQIGQMNLAIRTYDSFGPHQYASVEDPRSLGFQHAKRDVNSPFLRRRCESFRGRTGDGLRVRPRFLQAVKAITR